MVQEGHSVASLTGGIEGSQRDSVIDQFRSGTAKVLITTNVLARGIDVSTVSMVINYVSSRYHPHRREHRDLTHCRISPKSTNPVLPKNRPITKPISIVLVVRDVLAVSVSLSRLCRTATNGTCSCRLGNTSMSTSSASTPATGTKWRRPSRRPLRTLAPTRVLGSRPDKFYDF